MKKNKELYNICNILNVTSHLEGKKEKLELIKLYLKSNKKEELYDLIMNFSSHNFELKGQIKLIKKYLINKEDSNIISIIDSYFSKNNPVYINNLVDIYIESADQVMMHKLLTETSIIMFRKIDEIIELAKIYENVLKTAKFFEETFGEEISLIDMNVYSIIINYETNMKEDYKLDEHKKMIYTYLNENDFPTINFTRKVKTKC